ncbi:ROK family protein [Candidatus Sumerlaeota bacterium]|nr:ROK family protein [Candidatus Sumerlaeota bacterium]
MALSGKKLVIGVDGGGTKTNGVLMEEGGRILARTTVGSTNPHSNPEQKVREALHSMVDTLLDDGKATLDNVDGICMGMAGADRPADRGFLERIIREKIGATKKLIIVNDAVVAMVAVLGKLDGILVIAGTGSICYAFNHEKGESTRAGGWGHLLADEGSGYVIGLSALKAIMRAFDQRTAATSLTDRILAELKLNAPPDLVGWVYMGGNGKTEIAALSRIVHEEAEKGDAIASAILAEQADELVDIVKAVYKRLFTGRSGEVKLALWGGNLLNVEKYQKRFMDGVKATGHPVTPVIRHDAEAMIGAAQHALNNL